MKKLEFEEILRRLRRTTARALEIKVLALEFNQVTVSANDANYYGNN
jgi:hypothetical protein